MQRAFLTASYIAAHIATAMLCFAVILFVPLLITVVAALWYNDPGGPMFWPLFVLVLLAAGFATAFVCSTFVLFFDLLRLRWRIPLSIPPAIVFAAAVLCLVPIRPWDDCILVGLACSVVFCLYWLAVSSAWFLPRLLVHFVGSRSTAA